jgi:hypothetical protein
MNANIATVKGSTMPKREAAIRRHPVSIRVATTEAERKEMRRAADRKVRGAKAT